jgi:transitional endoplasmic reticulum ATPase
MPRGRRIPFNQSSMETSPIVGLWALRVLLGLGMHRDFIHDHGFSSDALAQVIGLGDWIDCTRRDFDRKKVLADMRIIHENMEKHSGDKVVPVVLRENVARLSKLVGLSSIDCRILEFAVMIRNESLLDETCDRLGALSSNKVGYALSVILDLPEKEVRSALGAASILATSGLVAVDRRGVSFMQGKLDLLSDHFADLISSSEVEPVGLLRDTVHRSAPATLSMDDYHHMDESLRVLRPYLKRSLHTGRKGVNVYIHGAPGTGKSELARALAAELACELFEVASEDAEGAPVNGEKRLRAYRAAQSFFGQRQTLLVFDEVEDVFDDGDGIFGRKSTAQTRKAWINRMLEDNLVPTIWLSNSIRGMDRAFIRRFDVVFELTVPPKKQREHIIQSVCANTLDAELVLRIAESPDLAPAVVTRAASVARSIADELGTMGVGTAIEKLISNTLQAQGHSPLRKIDCNRLPDIYDPTFIHADVNLSDVAIGLKQAMSGRLCLYGPPGTGKTAYARWLAEALGVPLLVKRASDLMSMYVGQNEKNIAAAFVEADRDGALLLIDEVDGFLQDRRAAKARWEASLVNEMLTQMESFSGIFVASTNLMAGLDQAALRRFDLKVKFDFLKPDQSCELFSRQSAYLAIDPPSSTQLSTVARLKNLTPGDFAVVARQSRFRRISSPAEMLSALEAECGMKEGAKSGIGFIH